MVMIKIYTYPDQLISIKIVENKISTFWNQELYVLRFLEKILRKFELKIEKYARRSCEHEMNPLSTLVECGMCIQFEF